MKGTKDSVSSSVAAALSRRGFLGSAAAMATGGGALAADETLGPSSVSPTSLALVSCALQSVSRDKLVARDYSKISVAYLDEGDSGGIFSFVSDDLSAQVIADPAQGVYIPPSSDTTGANGAWVRKFQGNIWAKWFGMSPAASGSANNIALQRAINFASQIRSTILTNKYLIVTSDVCIDRGLFKLYGNTMVYTGVRIVGQGKSNTILQHDGNGQYMFTYAAPNGADMFNTWILDLAVAGSGTSSADTLGAVSAQTDHPRGLAIYGCGVRNCLITNCYDGVVLQNSWTFEVSENQMYNIGRNFVRGQNMTAARIKHNRLDVAGEDGIYVTFDSATNDETIALHLSSNIIQGCQRRAVYGVDADHIMWDHNYIESNNQAGGYPAVEFASSTGDNGKMYSFMGGWVSPGKGKKGQPAFVIAKARMVTSHGVYIKGNGFSVGWDLGPSVEGYSIDGEFNGGPFISIDGNTTGIATSRASMSISGLDSEVQTLSTSASNVKSSTSVRLQELDCTLGSRTFTLQDKHLQSGRRFTVQKTDGSSNNLVIAPQATTYINGANASVSSSIPYARAEITCGCVAGTSNPCWFVKFS